MSDSSRLFTVCDMPDEMLIEIILFLNARERVALGNSCKRFHRLVFEEKKLLRDLDFSKEGYLTSMSDVQQYFNAKNKYEHIRKINVSNVYCTRQQEMLQNIAKAKNLVEVNVMGFQFRDFRELASFLEPLHRLKKLSIDWLNETKYRREPYQLLEGPVKALTYLKIMLYDGRYSEMIVPVLQYCQELEELCLLQIRCDMRPTIHSLALDTKKLKKLKKAVCYGANAEYLREMIVCVLPELEYWTEIKSNEAPCTNSFYFEKSLKVSEELPENVLEESFSFNQYNHIRRFLVFEFLLKEAIRIIDRTALNEFCCLTQCLHGNLCLLRIQDVKILLTNPRHQISYLRLNHNIEPECDAHLVASAFPGLTKLVLSNIINSKSASAQPVHLGTGFEKKHLALEKHKETPDLHLSFKKLVENTPRLEDLTICASEVQKHELWDLTALRLIADWESLTTLWLVDLPIKNGQFLVKIGKQCKNLQKLRLENLGLRGVCCYKNELLQMLAHCHNLKDFSIQQDNLGQVSQVFTTLAGNTKLRRVCVKSLGKGNNVDNLTLSIQRLAHSSTLILLICEIEGMTRNSCNKLKSSLQRLKRESNRLLFQFEIVKWNGVDEPIRNSSLHFVHKDLVMPHHCNDALYRLDCL